MFAFYSGMFFVQCIYSSYSSDGEALSGEQVFGLRTVFSMWGKTINDEGEMARDE